MPLSMLEPFIRAIGVLVSCPVSVLFLRRRIDNSCNVAGAAEHKLHRPGEDLRCRIGRLPGSNVIVDGRKEVAWCPDFSEVDVPASQLQAPRCDQAILHIDAAQEVGEHVCG